LTHPAGWASPSFFLAVSTADLRARVEDIAGNCADLLNSFFDALGSKVHSHNIGTLFERIKTIEVSQKPFDKHDTLPSANGLSIGDGTNRQIYVKPASSSAAEHYQEFRWNAIATTVLNELLHHSRDKGHFLDPSLDKAAFGLMSPAEQASARALMKKDNYEAGTVGHRFISAHCKPTNPPGPAPRRSRMSPIIPALILSFIGLFPLAPRNTVATRPKWRQIVLMRSTREDVERLLGQSKNRGFLASYRVKGGTLDVEYYPFHFCTPAPDADLRVHRWTVVEITYEPDNPPTLADLKLDLKKFRKVRESVHVPELVSYLNDEEGVDYTFQGDGTLYNIRYFPGRHFDTLRCDAGSTKRGKIKGSL